MLSRVTAPDSSTKYTIVRALFNEKYTEYKTIIRSYELYTEIHP